MLSKDFIRIELMMLYIHNAKVESKKKLQIEKQDIQHYFLRISILLFKYFVSVKYNGKCHIKSGRVVEKNHKQAPSSLYSLPTYSWKHKIICA